VILNKFLYFFAESLGDNIKQVTVIPSFFDLKAHDFCVMQCVVTLAPKLYEKGCVMRCV